VKSGRIRAIGLSSARRSSVAPDVPPVAETVPGFDENGQHGILVPANTPREIVQRLNAELVKAMNSAEIKSRLSAEGAELVGSSPEQYAQILRTDIAKWAQVIKTSGIRSE
jgi:tripartite-type tricarboxylate transporter receptor subunit TctC